MIALRARTAPAENSHYLYDDSRQTRRVPFSRFPASTPRRPPPSETPRRICYVSNVPTVSPAASATINTNGNTLHSLRGGCPFRQRAVVSLIHSYPHPLPLFNTRACFRDVRGWTWLNKPYCTLSPIARRRIRARTMRKEKSKRNREEKQFRDKIERESNFIVEAKSLVASALSSCHLIDDRG